MAEKDELIVFSKADIIDPEMLEEMVKHFEKEAGKKVALTISAGAYIRVEELKDLLLSKIPEKKQVVVTVQENEDGYLQEEAEKEKIDSPNMRVYDLKKRNDTKKCQIKKRENGDFDVTGERIEEIARMTDTRYVDGVNRIYDVMEKMGVMRRLKLIISDDMMKSNAGFFEGEEDFRMPSVWISEKKFSLE